MKIVVELVDTENEEERRKEAKYINYNAGKR